MKTKKILLFISTILSSFTHSQNETKKWYFGNLAGLDFATNPPTVLTNGLLTTGEGCASISDALGNLLFYTDGVTVRDQTHAIMANGNALFGNSSTTQSGTIIKQPGNTNIYFVFTLAAMTGINGLCYSIVDMNLAAGMGSVTAKNFTLYTPSCEKLTAVRHCNGTDTWVVTHDWNSDVFRSYLVTSAGVNPVPVLSSSGATFTGSTQRTIGHMKISPNGRKLGVANYDAGSPTTFEIYDFDPGTGIVSNPLVLASVLGPYGCEFSPDGTKFYGSQGIAGGQLFQWDLCAGTPSAIVASKYQAAITGNVFLGSLQLAANGMIYLARSSQQVLGVIGSPNLAGAACSFTELGLSVAPKMCNYGLPNFINSFFKAAPPPFTSTVTCQTASLSAPVSGFSLACSAFSVTAYKWNFGDPSSGTANTSTITNPVHIFSSAGTYTTKLIFYYGCSADSVVQVMNILANPALSVTGSTSLCPGEKKILTVSGANLYSWTLPGGPGPLTSSIVASSTVNSTFTVSGTNTVTGCVSTKTVSITVLKCTGVEESITESNFELFPNPFNKSLTIKTAVKAAVKIMNHLGMVVFEDTVEPGLTEINAQAFEPGIYFIKTVAGNSRTSKRLIKIE